MRCRAVIWVIGEAASCLSALLERGRAAAVVATEGASQGGAWGASGARAMVGGVEVVEVVEVVGA
jgi:hypothetical protein